MKKVEILKVVVSAILLVGLVSISSYAATKKIKPHQLKPETTNVDYFQNPEMIHTLGGTMYWTAVVSLPVGSRVTGVKYYHRGQNSSYTSVKLYRIKMGIQEEQMVDIWEDDTSDEIIEVEGTNILLPRVKSGYTYYVRVYSQNSDSNIHGIKIVYSN